MRPLADVIGDLENSMSGMGTGQRLEALGVIFPARQAAGAAELLSQGAGKLRQYTAALQGAGGTASRIAGVQLNTLRGDATILRSAIEGLAIAIGESLVGPVRVLTQLVTKVVAGAAQWIRENRELVVIVAAVAAGVGAAGVALVSLGVTAQVAAFMLGKFLTLMAAAKVVLVAIPAVLGAIASPLGIVISLAATLGGVWLYQSGVMGRAIEWIGRQFGRLREFVGQVVGGITDALAAGDMELAAKVLWLGLKVAWQEGIAALSRIWLEAKHYFLNRTREMWTGALAAAEFGQHGLKVGWIETTSFLSSTWQRFASFMQLSWDTIVNVATKAWNHIRGLFDGGLDVEAANLAADRTLVAAENKIETERDAALAALESERQGRRDTESQRNETALRDILDAEDQALRDLDADTNQKLTQTTAALAQARDELAAAVEKARAQRAQAGQETFSIAGQPGLPSAQDLANQLAQVQQRISVAGTFNAAAASGLGASSADERTARAVEDIKRQIERYGRTFGRASFTGP